jgi:hypothetical protein
VFEATQEFPAAGDGFHRSPRAIQCYAMSRQAMTRASTIPTERRGRGSDAVCRGGPHLLARTTFLASWIAVFTLSSWLDPAGSVSRYLGQYAWMSGVAILIEILAFVLPMLSVHRLMAAYKRKKLLPEADRLSRSIPSITDSDAARSPDDLAQRFRDLEDAPTWPVDRRIGHA